MGNKAKVDWKAHAKRFAASGLSLAEYTAEHGLNANTARRHLKSNAASSSPATSETLTATCSDAQRLRAAAISTDVIDGITGAFSEYYERSGRQMDYLRRACDSFDGLIPPTSDAYVTPEMDDNGHRISPHPDLDKLLSARLMMLSEAGKAISQITDKRQRAEMQILRIEREALRERHQQDAEQRQTAAVAHALAQMALTENPWSATAAATYIEARGFAIPTSLKTRLAAEMATGEGDEDAPEISLEELDAIALKGLELQRQRRQELEIRRMELDDEMSRAVRHADEDADFIEAGEDEIDHTATNDDNVEWEGGDDGQTC